MKGKIAVLTLLLVYGFLPLAMADYSIIGNVTGQCNGAFEADVSILWSNSSHSVIATTNATGRYIIAVTESNTSQTLTARKVGFTDTNFAVTVAGSPTYVSTNTTLSDFCTVYEATDVSAVLVDNVVGTADNTRDFNPIMGFAIGAAFVIAAIAWIVLQVKKSGISM